jgi:ABC-2 type transport system permease protein
MARYFARLKLRLLRNGLRGSPLRIVGLVLASVFGLQFGIAGFLLLVLPDAGRSPELHAAIPVVWFVVVFLGWAILPVFGFVGLDETLDPGRLVLLPLRRSQLQLGLLAASCIGVGPLVTVVALGGALFGYAWFGPGTAVVALAVVVELGLCLTVSRAITSALTRVMRSRRGRDLLVIFSFLVFIFFNVLAQLPRLLRGISPETGRAVLAVLGWLPPGLVGRAVAEADAGNVLLATGYLLLGASGIAPLALWWSRSLGRLTTTVESTPHRSPAEARRAQGRGVALRRRRFHAEGGTLFPSAARFLPRNRLGAVAAKELRYLWREPQFRAQRLLTAVVALAAVIGLVGLPRVRDPEGVLIAAALLWLFTFNAINQFASDRAAYWMNVVATGDPRADLVGKNLAGALVNIPVFLLVAIALAALTGGWAYVPLAICLAIGALGTSFALGNIASTRAAQPLPESTTNLWGTATGQGCGTALLQLAALVLHFALIVPILLLVIAGLTIWRPLLLVAGIASVAYGAVLYGIGLRISSAWLRGHEPELLESLSRQPS